MVSSEFSDSGNNKKKTNKEIQFIIKALYPVKPVKPDYYMSQSKPTRNEILPTEIHYRFSSILPNYAYILDAHKVTLSWQVKRI